MVSFWSGVNVRRGGAAAGSVSSVTSPFWARVVKDVELVRVMGLVLSRPGGITVTAGVSRQPDRQGSQRYRDRASPIFGDALSPVLLRNAIPSVLHQRHIGRVLRSSCDPAGRRLASSRRREPQPGRCLLFGRVTYEMME